jgi:hypothetical protein
MIHDSDVVTVGIWIDEELRMQHITQPMIVFGRACVNRKVGKLPFSVTMIFSTLRYLLYFFAVALDMIQHVGRGRL